MNDRTNVKTKGGGGNKGGGKGVIFATTTNPTTMPTLTPESSRSRRPPQTSRDSYIYPFDTRNKPRRSSGM